jgi:hypothetical protein
VAALLAALLVPTIWYFTRHQETPPANQPPGQPDNTAKVEPPPPANQPAGQPDNTAKVEPPPPQSPAAILEQAQGHAGRREWQKAARAYSAIIDHAVPRFSPGEVAFEYAAVLLLSGDLPAYKKVRGKLLERCGVPGVRPYHVARACTLAPGSFTLPEVPRKLLEGELKAAATEFWTPGLEGALHHRAGNYADSLGFLQRCRDHRGNSAPGVACARMWLALTHYRLNQPAEARPEFEQAEKWLEKFPAGIPYDSEKRVGVHLHNWLEIHVLRLEVAPLLRPGPVKDKSAQKSPGKPTMWERDSGGGS